MTNLYTYVLFVHILAGAVLIGGGLLVSRPTGTGIHRATTLGELRSWLATSKQTPKIAGTAAGLLLLSGAYLTWRLDRWDAAWIQIAIVLWVVNSLLASRIVGPGMARLGGLVFAASGDVISPEVERARSARSVPFAEDMMLASDIGVLFLMVARPSGYFGSAMVVVVSAVAVLGYGWLRAGRARTRRQADGSLADGTMAPGIGSA